MVDGMSKSVKSTNSANNSAQSGCAGPSELLQRVRELAWGAGNVARNHGKKKLVKSSGPPTIIENPEFRLMVADLEGV